MKHLNLKSIRFQLISVTLVYAFVLILLITVSYHIFYESFARKKIIRNTEFNLELISNTITQHVRNVCNFSEWCASNAAISTYLMYGDKDPEQFSTYERLREEFYNYPSHQYIDRAIISNYNHQFLQILASNPENASIYDSAVIYQTLCMNPEKLPAAPTMLPPRKDPLGRSDKLIIPVIQNISVYNQPRAGWIYLALPLSIITDATENYKFSDADRLFFSVSDQLYEITGNTVTPAEADWEEGKRLDHMAQESSLSVQKISFSTSGRKGTMITFHTTVENLSFYQISTEVRTVSKDRFYSFTLLCSLALVLLLTYVMVLFLNRLIGRPLSLISHKISRASEGDFSKDPSIEGDSEIGEVGRGINIMCQNIIGLIDSTLVMERQKKELELQILQNQIGPHFLYNTLNSIRLMAILQKTSGIPEMTTALAHLLKNISQNGMKLIPLKEELSLLNDYYLIQKYRYSGNLTLETWLEEESLCQCLIPSMTLQPLVENAIFHGIEPKGTPGLIRIEITSHGKGNLLITIRDNGAGIPREILPKLLSGGAASPGREKIGLKNVNSRLKHYFPAGGNGQDALSGDVSYGITIDSVEGEYTCVSLLIPKTFFI